MVHSQKTGKIRSSFAFDVNGNEITVQTAASGRRGYYCPFCTRQLEAVKPLQSKPRPYFRHVATDIDRHQVPCIYSDESYRHKVAKEILVRLKSIKVPRVPKYPPRGFDGPTKEVASSRTVTASIVHVEMAFYEDENQTLHWGKADDVEHKDSFMRPDVVFFNARMKPILFIELVATHRPDPDKLAKLKRLGIDTVTVKVPTESSQAIEECFSHTLNTKWLYNNEQERADYFRLPGPPPERISDVDVVQRRLFEETILCRQNRIRNLVRALDACLGTQQYMAIERGIREEISRVDAKRNGLGPIEDQFENEVLDEFAERRRTHRAEEDRLREEEGKLGIEEEGVERNFEDLEGRYRTKRDDLERQGEALTERIRSRLIESGVTGKTFSERKREIESETKRTEEAIIGVRTKIEATDRELEGLPRKYEQLEKELRNATQATEESIRKDIEELQRADEELPGKFEQSERSLREEFERRTAELTARLDQLRRDAHQAVGSRTGVGDSALSTRIKGLLEARESLSHFKSHYAHLERIRRAYECANSKAYQNWND